MSKVRFKTRIFEIVYLSLFCTFSIILFFILALQVYDKSFIAFVFLLICALIECILFIISALVLYQYCEFIDGVFIFKCPLYVIKKVKVEDIVLYDRLSIYEKGTRMNIVYPVIRIYLSKPTSKIKYKYWCNKKSTYFHIYDKKDNYDKFIKIMNGKEKTS
jgi:hypothetical protein